MGGMVSNRAFAPSVLAAFIVTALLILMFLLAANYVFPDQLYWPGVAVALPATPAIMLAGLLFPSLQPAFFCMFPAIFWGLVAALIARGIAQRRERTQTGT